MEEKRRFPRLSLMADVVYSKVSFEEKEKLTISKNISKGGICFIAYDEILPGNILNLEIYLPQESLPIRALGRVVWSKKFAIASEKDYWGDRYDVGVEFIQISDTDRERLQNYIFKFMPL